MYTARQLHYLQVLGIPAWRPKHTPAVGVPAGEANTPGEPAQVNPETAVVTAAEAGPAAGKAVDGDTLPQTLTIPAVDSSAQEHRQPDPADWRERLVLAEPASPGTLPIVLMDSPELEQATRQGAERMYQAMLQAIGLGPRTVQRLAIGGAAAADSTKAAPLLSAFLAALQQPVLLFVMPDSVGGSARLSSIRGQGELETPGGSPSIVTWHPAWLLSHPDLKRDTWQDLKQFRSLIETASTESQ